MQFDLNLLFQFSVTTQINSIAAMITYVSGLPVDKPTGKDLNLFSSFTGILCVFHTHINRKKLSASNTTSIQEFVFLVRYFKNYDV